MKETVLKIGRLTQSNTYYRGDKALYEVHAGDGAVLNDPWCINYFNDILKTSESAIFAENLENVTVDFGGATLRLYGMLQPVTFYRCNHVTLKNVNIEYNRGLFSEGAVLEVGENWARVHFSADFPCRVQDGRLIPYCDEWEDDHLFERQMFFQFFDNATGDGTGITLGIVGPKLPEGMNLCFHPVQYVVETAGEDVIFRTVDGAKLNDAWRPGALLAIEHGGRFYPGVLLQSCRDVTLENVRLVNTNSMGILPLHCQNVTLRQVNMFRDEKSHGLLTNSADGIHGITNGGSFLMEDCIIEDVMDDILNIHGQYQIITDIQGNRLTVKITSHGVTQYSNLADVGDEVAIHVENTMEERSRHKVTAVKLLDQFTAELTLDTAPVGVQTGDLLENLFGNCDLTLRRCRFARCNTHLRFQTRGKILVEDCVTERPFWLTGDATFWYESSPCTDMTIRNTYFVGPAANIYACPEVRVTDKEKYYHKHLTVENCTFTTDRPMNLRYTDDIRFIANRNANGQRMTVHLYNSGAIDAPDALVERETEKQVLGNN